MMRTALPLLLAVLLAAAPKAIFPPGIKPVGPYSPGLMAGDFLYVSGQGARDANNQIAATPEEQVRQTLENVKSVVQAAGLTMEHVVYAQTYLANIKNYEVMNKVWVNYFPKNPPARSTIAVTRMPTDTPFEIAAIAVRDLKTKKIVQHPGRKMPVPVSPAVVVKDRAFLTGGLGRVFETGSIPKEAGGQVKLTMDTADAVLKAAGMELRHLAYVNIYVTPQMPMKALVEAIDEYIPDETAKTIIQTSALPFGVNLEISGVASRSMKRLGNCTGIEDTVYCAGRAGTINQALTSLKADLAANHLSLANVVSSNVYVEDIDKFAEMNKVYATFFAAPYPTRTTVQPWKKGTELTLAPATGVAPDKTPGAQVSVIAVR
jgi:reactive intermediate/imine deaminase